MLLKYLWNISNKKPTQRKAIKILRAKQMLQRIPISLAQVKAGKTSQELSKVIRQS